MSKNLIPKIAEMLGVELEEEFKVKGQNRLNYNYKFDNDGLRAVSENRDTGKRISYVAAGTFIALLTGEREIVKLPWKPKADEMYFSFGSLGGTWVVCSSRWRRSPNEYAKLEKGWVFRTMKEAKAALPKVAAEMGVDYEL